MHTGSPSFMRKMNKRIVLDIIKKNKVVTKPQLCEITQLKPPTMNNVIDSLLKDDLIICIGKGESNSNGGPRPNLYSLNNKGRYFIGLDIGRTGIVGVLMNIDSEIEATEQISNVQYESQEFLTELILDVINRLLGKCNIGLERLANVGISVAALVDIETGVIISDPSSVFNNYPITASLSKTIRSGIYVDNDINMIALGQRLLVDEFRELNNVICLGIRDGIGMALIIDGKVYRGRGGLSCNLQGISLAEAEDVMLENVRNYLRTNGNGGLVPVDLHADTLTIQDMYRAVKENGAMSDIVDRSFEKIGQFVGMLDQLLGPDAIIVAGEIFNYNSRFFKTLVGSSLLTLNSKPMPQTTYHEVPLAYHTIASCAALYVLNDYYKIKYIDI